MDAPLPEDFDPYSLEDPMQNPSKSSNERNQRNGAPSDVLDGVEQNLPMHELIPPWLKKALFTGSCCTGVAVLYFIAAWDHGWIPGIGSQFASADDANAIAEKYEALKYDVAELYVLSLERAIRDVSSENCIAPSRMLTEQLAALQYKYKARTGERYPHVCPRT